MKVVIVNGNENNDRVKYDFISKIEEELDKENLVIKVDYHDFSKEDELGLEDMKEAYIENDFDVYIYAAYHNASEIHHKNTILRYGVKEEDIFFVNPTNVAVNVKNTLEFLSNN